MVVDGIALLSPDASWVLEASDQLFLLGVDTQYGIAKKRSFDRWNVTGGFEVFTADQDPLDPNEVPFFAAEVPPFSARRIPVGR